MLLIATCKNTKNSIFLKLKNPITMHIAHVIRFAFLIKIREIFTFNISFIDVINILTVGELPSHSHSGSTNITGGHNHAYRWVSDGRDTFPYSPPRPMGSTQYTSTNGNHSHTLTINNTGNNQSHNNMMPYLAIYIWKRVS